MPRSHIDARQVAVEAYVYLYPLVTMEVTRRQLTNAAPGQVPGRAPMGQFAHIRQFPAADFKVVVRPNFDTLYSSTWLDLSAEPTVLTVPDTDGRYYLMPMYDMWTDAFASPGWRTTGTSEGHFALTAPGWSGTLPDGVERISAPTPVVWIIGRTQTNGPADYDAVARVQDGYTLTPLSQWGRPAAAPAPFTPDPSVDMTTPPLELVDAMPAVDYFTLGAELMAVHPPHATDFAVLHRMAQIGLRPGAFDPGALDAEVSDALQEAPTAAQQLMVATMPRLARVANGWSMNTDSMGVYGNFYLKRAIVAQIGLGANQVDDAIYPLLVCDDQGRPLHGDHRYVWHLEADQLPPVDAFWSLTMYDDQGFQSANPIDRFAIGDRDALTFHPDGSLDIYIQHESPGADLESNWLPAPASPLGLTARLYAPKPEALDGRWNPPPVRLRT